MHCINIWRRENNSALDCVVCHILCALLQQNTEEKREREKIKNTGVLRRPGPWRFVPRCAVPAPTLCCWTRTHPFCDMSWYHDTIGNHQLVSLIEKVGANSEKNNGPQLGRHSFCYMSSRVLFHYIFPLPFRPFNGTWPSLCEAWQSDMVINNWCESQTNFRRRTVRRPWMLPEWLGTMKFPSSWRMTCNKIGQQRMGCVYLYGFNLIYVFTLVIWHVM